MLPGQSRVPAAVALAAAVAIGWVGLARGTWAAGGSDSACYALMADALAHGALQPTSALADAPWPDALRTLAPGGFVPSPVRPDAASPICAPGFSVFLAPLVLIGGRDALFLLTPLAGCALVLLSFALARRIGGPIAGAIAAVLVASSPIVLFQVVQPMNDILTAALWLAVVVALGEITPRRLMAGGVLTGCALLVRPNLVPVGLAVAVWVFATADSDQARGRWKAKLGAVARFGVAVVPFGLVVLWFNDALYGHALRSGYGDASALFAWANVPVNAATHLRALVETQLGFPLLGLVAPFVIRREWRLTALAVVVAATVIACYMPYSHFPEWWYLRFLLPAVVLLVTLAAALLARLAVGSRPTAAHGSGLEARGVALAAARLAAWRRAALIALTVLVGVYQLRTAGERQVFELHRMESRYRHVAEAMLEHLPAQTVAISVWDSGSVRFHARREAVLWDSLDPAWLDRAAAWLLAKGRPPVIVVERWEESLFRARFAARSTIGGLDWPPRIDVNGLIRIYDPADRVRYLAGQRVETIIFASAR